MTLEEKKNIVDKVNTLKEKGMTTKEACKSVGIKAQTLYQYNWELNKSKPTVVTYPANKKQKQQSKPKQSNTRIVALIGTTEQVLAALRGL